MTVEWIIALLYIKLKPILFLIQFMFDMWLDVEEWKLSRVGNGIERSSTIVYCVHLWTPCDIKDSRTIGSGNRQSKESIFFINRSRNLFTMGND